jgi:branched-chain amino acid transport system ATP-binding protein
MEAARPPLASMRGVTAGYGGQAVIHEINLSLPERTCAAVVGPNGSGKSTLMRALVGLIRPMAGSVSLGGLDVSGLDAWRRARLGLAYVPQERNVFQNMTVGENLRLAAEAAADGRDARRAGEERVLALFPSLAARLKTVAGHLSGGQRQTLAMASALTRGPSLMLLDEPSAGLSPLNAASLFESVATIKAEGVGLIIVEQNVKLALALADFGVVLVGGEVRLTAPARELTPARLHEFYLGAGR